MCLSTGDLRWPCRAGVGYRGRAQPTTNVSRCASEQAVVVFAVILAALILGEPLNWQHCVGGGFIIIGA
jgi:uncharacterized membrane protein